MTGCQLMSESKFVFKSVIDRMFKISILNVMTAVGVVFMEKIL